MTVVRQDLHVDNRIQMNLHCKLLKTGSLVKAGSLNSSAQATSIPMTDCCRCERDQYCLHTKCSPCPFVNGIRYAATTSHDTAAAETISDKEGSTAGNSHEQHAMMWLLYFFNHLADAYTNRYAGYQR